MPLRPGFVALALIGAVSTVPAHATVFTSEVFAKENSIAGGVLLDSGIDLLAGDHLLSTVAIDDCWSAGEGNRVSNADGLTGASAACPPTGNYGLLTVDSVALPFGTLVGRIGATGTFFALGTAFDATVTTSGRLFLGYWDLNASDNFGSVTATLVVNPGSSDVPEPATWGLAGLGLLAAARSRRRR